MWMFCLRLFFYNKDSFAGINVSFTEVPYMYNIQLFAKCWLWSIFKTQNYAIWFYKQNALE